MKKVNGSECTCDDQGLITSLKDALGRTWTFTYRKRQLVHFVDPQGLAWDIASGKWQPEVPVQGVVTPKCVAINHATGEIRVEDSVRLTVYMPDGTTQIEVTQIIDGAAIRVHFTEFPTRPHRAFVVVEQRNGKDYVTWLQDANSKLFKMEYEKGKLVRYIDMSAKPSIIWSASYDAAGSITGWEGRSKISGQSVGKMHPILQSVEINGNRHFRSATGSPIVVDPSGAAFAPKSPTAASAPAGFVPPFTIHR